MAGERRPGACNSCGRGRFNARPTAIPGSERSERSGGQHHVGQGAVLYGGRLAAPQRLRQARRQLVLALRPLPPAALDVAPPAALDARRQDGALEPAGAGKSHQVPLLFAHHVELEGLAGAVVAREHQVFVPSRPPLHLPPRPPLCAQGLAKAAYGQRREGSRRLTKRGATLFAAHKECALCVAAQRLCAEVTHKSVTHRCAARGFIRRNCAVRPTTPARFSIDFKGSHWQSHTRIAAESAAWRASAHHVDLPLTVSPNEGPHCTRLLDEMDRLAGGLAEQEVQAAGEDDMMSSHPGRGRGLASGPAWYSPRAGRAHTGTRTCASIERSPLPDPSI